MPRYFEKISFEQFKKDIKDDLKLYNSYELPKRKTKYSAGYDFELIEDLVLKPNETKKISLGIKAKFNENEGLFLIVRSSLGFKYNLRMCNQVGLIDSDYYNNSSNEGHMFVKLQNHSEEEVKLKKEAGIIQGIFFKYLTVDDEEKIENERKGGFGSTNKGDEKNE